MFQNYKIRIRRMPAFLSVLLLLSCALRAEDVANSEVHQSIREQGDVSELREKNPIQLVDPKVLPKEVLQKCVQDFQTSVPKYPKIDVKKLRITKAIQHDAAMKLYYITYYHSAGLGTHGGIAYVYDDEKKEFVRKFWLPPEGDE